MRWVHRSSSHGWSAQKKWAHTGSAMVASGVDANVPGLQRRRCEVVSRIVPWTETAWIVKVTAIVIDRVGQSEHKRRVLGFPKTPVGRRTRLRRRRLTGATPSATASTVHRAAATCTRKWRRTYDRATVEDRGTWTQPADGEDGNPGSGEQPSTRMVGFAHVVDYSGSGGNRERISTSGAVNRPA